MMFVCVDLCTYEYRMGVFLCTELSEGTTGVLCGVV